jgi:hypothetical protein
LQHVLLVQFHLRHSNGVKCLKLGSADIAMIDWSNGNTKIYMFYHSECFMISSVISTEAIFASNYCRLDIYILS